MCKRPSLARTWSRNLVSSSYYYLKFKASSSLSLSWEMILWNSSGLQLHESITVFGTLTGYSLQQDLKLCFLEFELSASIFN